MGFCRRCGEIVLGVRCQCGGTAVAPVVPWNQSTPDNKSQDKWSRTYVQRAKSVSPTRPLRAQVTSSSPATSYTVNRFPRPVTLNSPSDPPLGHQVSTHITATTTRSARPPSHLKSSTVLPSPELDILPSIHPNDTTLSKVYGSVLQLKETLETHSCAICSSSFAPDATIYPDPTAPNTSRYLCRPCFEKNGGSKGTCPTCSRSVLTLKSEGGFIHASGNYWHKRCFNCSGCFRNIGDSPMVDLLGRPSCADCFDNCLKRDPVTPRKSASAGENPTSKEASPAIVEELEQRLGIVKSHSGSPALEDLSQRLSMIGRESRSRPLVVGRYTPTSREHSPLLDRSRGRFERPDESPTRRYEQSQSRPSPARRASGNSNTLGHQTTGSPAPTQEAIDEMKQRFMKGSSQSPHPKSPPGETYTGHGSPHLHLLRSSTSLNLSPKASPLQAYDEPTSPYSPSLPLTPDLMSDFSDSVTQSSPSGSPLVSSEDTGDVFRVSGVHSSFNSQHTKGDFVGNRKRSIVEGKGDEWPPPTHLLNSGRVLRTPTSTPSKIINPSIFPHSSSQLSSPNAPVRDTKSLAPSSCASCGGKLSSVQGGKFVTVPANGMGPSITSYHVDCFKCVVCKGSFGETSPGQAVFVRFNGGACHVQCAPVEKITVKKLSSSSDINRNLVASPPNIPALKSSPRASYKSSSRLDQPLLPVSPTSTVPRRFGSTTLCPGCKKAVSPMEYGVIPGPQGTRWHASCLVCGGKKETTSAWGIWKGREEKGRGEPGCGKRLDSAAKTTGDGNVWCRECLLLLGIGGSPQRVPLVPSHTGSVNTQIVPQFTGTTTLARQFTGLGGNGEPGLLRQLTGGGLSPTRSISPTKQLGGVGGMRPRPKSVIGMRSVKSVDEGRGMFLVRQLTGAGN